MTAPEPEPALRDRVLAAAYECVARFGIAKTTVEDVVKQSGVSRATVYRVFPGGKEQLLRAAYIATARNNAKVTSYLAQQVVESAGKLPVVVTPKAASDASTTPAK